MAFSHFRRRDQAVGPAAQPRVPSLPSPEVVVSPEVVLPSETSEMSAVLVDEVEAFLGGRIVEHLVAAGRAVPAWTVLNKLAHAPVEELRDLARSGDEAGAGVPGDGGEPLWLRAQRSLAADLVAGAATAEKVAGAQGAVLIPLELWLIERSKAETITSRRAAEIASDVLADYLDGR